MNESALMKHPAHDKKDISVCLLNVNDLGIFESGCPKAVLTDELHDYDVVLEKVGLGGLDQAVCHVQTLQVSYFLFCPELDHLARVRLAVTFAETELS